MALSFTHQPTSSIMSIGAITTPCSNIDNQKSRQSSFDSTYKYSNNNNSTHSKAFIYQNQVGVSSPIHPTTTSSSVGQWIKSSNGTVDLTNTYEKPKHMRFSSEGTTMISSPVFSSSASSDHESDSNSSCSQISPNICKSTYPKSSNWLSSIYNMSDNKHMIHNRNLYAKEALSSEHLLNDFDMEDYQDFNDHSNTLEYCDGQKNTMYSEKGTSLMKHGRRSDALATRRARNKLASAKYRAKKQALTHAMQDRIMQLATQVMSLRDELSQTKKSETELLDRYQRLATYYQRTSGKINKHDSVTTLF